MKKMNGSFLATDGYKIGHHKIYPQGPNKASSVHMKQIEEKLTLKQKNFLYFVREKTNYPDNVWRGTINHVLHKGTMDIPSKKNLQYLREDYIAWKLENPESSTYTDNICKTKNGDMFCYEPNKGERINIPGEIYNKMMGAVEKAHDEVMGSGTYTLMREQKKFLRFVHTNHKEHLGYDLRNLIQQILQVGCYEGEDRIKLNSLRIMYRMGFKSRKQDYRYVNGKNK